MKKTAVKKKNHTHKKEDFSGFKDHFIQMPQQLYGTVFHPLGEMVVMGARELQEKFEQGIAVLKTGFKIPPYGEIKKLKERVALLEKQVNRLSK